MAKRLRCYNAGVYGRDNRGETGVESTSRVWACYIWASGRVVGQYIIMSVWRVWGRELWGEWGRAEIRGVFGFCSVGVDLWGLTYLRGRDIIGA